MLWNIDLTKIPELLSFNPADPLIFSTSLFLILFSVFLLFYNLLGKKKSVRIGMLIFFSLFFYYKSAGYYAGILVLLAGVNFLSGKWIAGTEKLSYKRFYLLHTVIINVGILGYFKYTNFIIDIFNGISGNEINPLNIFLPIGISFYTFKSLSYVFDIYLESMESTNSFRDFCLYVFFFPNILAGPIDRASAFLPQIDNEPYLSKEDMGKAVLLIMVGLIKKVVIADYIGINFVDRVFDFPLRFTGLENLAAVYAYALQIYCDFSGYTDMAIGIALLLGFKLIDNFNYPFKATSIADFWRRWHISLSKWLLDYLFKPIQMSARSLRVFGNVTALLITFLICGIWHGAGWNYILWGAFHGAMMSFSLFIQTPRAKLFTFLKIRNTKFLKFFQVFFTFHLVAFSFMIFKTRDFQSVIDMLGQIVNFFHGEIFFQFVERMPVIVVLMLLGYLFHFLPNKVETFAQRTVSALPLIGKAILLALVIWIAAQFKSADIQPFIYFQF